MAEPEPDGPSVADAIAEVDVRSESVAAEPQLAGSPSIAGGSERPLDSSPPIADGIARPLDPRVIPLNRLVGSIATGTISLGLLVGLVILLLTVPLAGWARGLLVLLWAVATLALAWFSYRWPEVEHRYVRYKVDQRGIEICNGVVWRSVINVPRSRVQHTDVSQGPLERRYGLGTLMIYTAGTDYAKVDLNGLDHATALHIRDHLLPGEAADAV